MKVPTLQVGQQFQCGSSANEKGEYVGLVGFGRGERLIRGSAYIAGPLMIGNPSSWIARENFNEANVMIARCGNTEADPESIPSIFKITNKDSGFETRPNDVVLGDEGGGEVGIHIDSSSFKQINDGIYEITTELVDIDGKLNVEGTSHLEGDVTTGGDMTIGGYASWSGSIVATTKLFDIPHPVRTGYRLDHVATESPQADLIYRGKTALVAGIATINIDTAAGMTAGTFDALCDNIQCFTSNETGWTAVKGSVSGSDLTIQAQTSSCTDTISWMVGGEREDIPDIVLEYQDGTKNPNLYRGS